MKMRRLAVATSLVLVFLGTLASSCSDSNHLTVNSLTQTKVSSVLLLQISLIQEQLASPTPDRLARMQAQGINITNLGNQRIYIYLKQQLAAAQTSELMALGITVYLDSWVPPTGNNPDGFYLADLPVVKLDALAAKDYVVRLDTAEKPSQPQPDMTNGD
jgi:hypothetical protein